MLIQKIFTTTLLLAIISCGCGQSSTDNLAPVPCVSSLIGKADIDVGGPCEDCHMMYEGIPDPGKIQASAKLSDDKEAGQKMLLKGKVLTANGKLAAPNVVLYFYQTDASGRYIPEAGQTAGKRHGHLRGWVKTDSAGEFNIHSIRPASYPNSRIPAHLHILVKEPGKTRYYIDDVVFSDDPFLTDDERTRAQKRGGSHIVSLRQDSSGTWIGNLSITLGLNIPGYP